MDYSSLPAVKESIDRFQQLADHARAINPGSDEWFELPVEERRKRADELRKYGFLAPKRDGVLTETLEGVADASLGVLEGFGSTLSEAGFTDALDEYASGVRARHRDIEAPEDYKVLSWRPSDIGRTIGNAFGTTVPSLAVGGITTLATGNPALGMTASTAAMFAHTWGDKVREYREAMPDMDEAGVKGLAAFEALGESLIENWGPWDVGRGIYGALAKKATNTAVEQTAKKFGHQAVWNVLKKMGTGAIEEGSEEVLQTYWDVFTRKLGGDRNVPWPTWEQVRDQFAGGAIGGAGLGMFGSAFEGGVNRLDKWAHTTPDGMPAKPKFAKLNVEHNVDFERAMIGKVADAIGVTVREATPEQMEEQYQIFADQKGVSLDDAKKGTIDGWKDPETDEIYVNPNASHGMMRAFGHEVKHFIDKKFPELAKVFDEQAISLMNENGKAALKKIEEDYGKAGKAQEEFLCDVCGQLVMNPNALENFCTKLEAKQQGMGAQFIEAVRNFVRTVLDHLRSTGEDGSELFQQFSALEEEYGKMMADLAELNHYGRKEDGTTRSFDAQAVNTAEVKTDPAFFQHRKGADAKTGVVPGHKLTGKYSPTTGGNFLFWEDKNGQKWLVNGHHRWQLAQEQNVPKVNGIVLKESEGVTKEQAREEGIKVNLREGTATPKDAAEFFRNNKMTQEEARADSLLKEQDTNRNTSNGYWIGTFAGDDLYANFRDGSVSANKAAVIAEASQGDAALEAAGMKLAKNIGGAQLRSALSLLKQSREKVQVENPTQGDLFGFDDSAIRLAEQQSRIAAKHIGELRSKVSIAKKAADLGKDKANIQQLRKELGVNVKNFNEVKQKLAEWQQELNAWEHYDTNPELIDQINRELNGVETPRPAVNPEPKIIKKPDYPAKPEPAETPKAETPKAESDLTSKVRNEPREELTSKVRETKTAELETARVNRVKLSSPDEITDEDFLHPYRDIELPHLPEETLKLIGKESKPILLKKTIQEKNRANHSELTPAQNREVLDKALYHHDLIGQSQAVKRPSYWVAVKLGDKNAVVVIDMQETKAANEIIGWRLIRNGSLEGLKRQAAKEGGVLTDMSGNPQSVSTTSSAAVEPSRRDDRSPHDSKEASTPSAVEADKFSALQDGSENNIASEKEIANQEQGESNVAKPSTYSDDRVTAERVMPVLTAPGSRVSLMAASPEGEGIVIRHTRPGLVSFFIPQKLLKGRNSVFGPVMEQENLLGRRETPVKGRDRFSRFLVTPEDTEALRRAVELIEKNYGLALDSKMDASAAEDVQKAMPAEKFQEKAAPTEAEEDAWLELLDRLPRHENIDTLAEGDYVAFKIPRGKTSSGFVTNVGLKMFFVRRWNSKNHDWDLVGVSEKDYLQHTSSSELVENFRGQADLAEKIGFHFPEEIQNAIKEKGTNGKPEAPNPHSDSAGGVVFSYRAKEPPKKTLRGYKLMRIDGDGNLYALFIDRANRMKLGSWYDADSPEIGNIRKLSDGIYLVDRDGNATAFTRANMPSVKEVDEATVNGGRYMKIDRYRDGSQRISNIGVNGSGTVAAFAYRPGWHATNAPSAPHIGGGQRRANEVWVEIEYAADNDFRQEAASKATPMKNGQPNPKEAQLDHIPEDGFYYYRTNSNADEKQDWILTGSIKPVRILSDAEVERINREGGFRPDAQRKEARIDNTKFSYTRQKQAEREYAEVVAKYRGTPQWMKAPNGAATLLSERQWVQTRTPPFKAWFGDWENDPQNASKVLDGNGEPRVVYHGTNSRFFEFSDVKMGKGGTRKGKGTAPYYGRGYYFTDDYYTAQLYGRRVMECFLNLRKPSYSSELGDGDDGHAVTTGFHKTFVVLNPSQIKSATDNVGTFDNENNDVRFSYSTHPQLSIARRNETLQGITTQVIAGSIDNLVASHERSGDYKFASEEERKLAKEGALKFFDLYAHKQIPLSNGHFVYFMPDSRAFERLNGDNLSAWAEYCIHAVTSSGKKIEGKDYAQRLYNPTKAANIERIEDIIKEEHAFAVLRQNPQDDKLTFVGASTNGKRMEIITKLDSFGDINANYTEVTVLITKKAINNPPLTPLAEAVSAVAQHQAAGFLTGDDSNITPNSEPSSALGENSPENGVKFSYTPRQWKEMDKAYLDAVQRGDMATAERMVRDREAEMGYSNDESWKMDHRAPSKKTGDVSLVDLKDSGLVPADYWDHPEWYTSSPEERESFHIIKNALALAERRKAEGNDRPVGIRMYRAVDRTKNRLESEFRNGDWVTPSRAYAENEGLDNPNGHRIISRYCLLRNLYWDGNSIAELGYDDGNDYSYKDTANNRKLRDVVTYDDDGNVIPLSKRFNKREADTRFSYHRREQVNPILEDGQYKEEYQAGLDADLYERQSHADLLRQARNEITRMGGMKAALEAFLKGRRRIASAVDQTIAKALVNSPEYQELSKDEREAFGHLYRKAGTEAGQTLEARKHANWDLRDINNLRNFVNDFATDMQLEHPEQNVRKKIKEATGVDIDNLPESLTQDHAALDKFLRSMSSEFALKRDKFYEYWVNAILSALTTHMANTIGNVGNGIYELAVKRPVEALVNLVVRNPQGATFGELKHMWQAFDWRKALEASKPLLFYDMLDTEGKFDMEHGTKAAIGGMKGRIIRTPGRFLRFADQLVKNIIRPVEATAMAYREAKAQGLNEAQTKEYILKELADDKSHANEYGRQRALELTFNEDPGAVVKALISLRNSNKVLAYLFPFIRTPANLLRQGVRKGPLGAINLAWETVQLARGQRKADNEYIAHVAEQIVFWGAMMALMAGHGDDDEPWITGNNLTFGAEGAFKRVHLPPMSIRIGSKWYAYNRIEPLATGLASFADGYNAYRNADSGKKLTSAMKMMMTGALKVMKDKTYLDEIGQISRLLEDPERTLGDYAANFFAGWVPNAYRQTVNAFHDAAPNYKAGSKNWILHTFQQTFSRAGLYHQVPKLDYFGRPVPKDLPLDQVGPGSIAWRLIMPVARREAENMDPVEKLMWNYNKTAETPYWPSLPSPHFQLNGKRYEVENYDAFATRAGQLAHQEMLRAVKQRRLNVERPGKYDIDLIRRIFTEARKRAKMEFLQKKQVIRQ